MGEEKGFTNSCVVGEEKDFTNSRTVGEEEWFHKQLQGRRRNDECDDIRLYRKRCEPGSGIS